MNERFLLFNPFDVKNKSNNDLRDIYNEVYKEIRKDEVSMYDYAHNIEVYSNLNYIIGECIARLTKDVIELKTEIEVNKAIKCVEERQNWNNEDGKIPAMAYFEALATRFCEDKINQLAEKECSLRRFKNAYNSTEEKMNAIKKKMDAVKFEVVQ